MRIVIYKEYGSGCIGGSEFMMAVLADGLAAEHDVTIVHHQPELTAERLFAMFGMKLQRTTFRYVAPLPRHNVASINPWRKYRDARNRYADLSRDAEVFVCLTHGEESPPFCHAKLGMLVVLFPLSQRPALSSNRHNGTSWTTQFKERWGARYLEWEWRRRLASYQVKTSISEFVRKWTQRFWGIDTHILYPPVETATIARPKLNSILCVGRFSALKNQRMLIDTFRGMPKLTREPWRLVCAGGVGTAPQERQYFADLEKLADGHAISLMPNVAREKLQDLYASTPIFWHAAGYGDEDENPGQSEHFGIATVEAMAAGCVPVVIRKGGQTELIDHGTNGFLWSTPAELRNYTHLLANDADLRGRMADAARKRAQAFDKRVCVDRFRSLVAPYAPDVSTYDLTGQR